MRLTRTVAFATLFQEFDEEESLALEHSLLGAKESSEVGDQFSARKLRFELDLQDGVLTKASPMLKWKLKSKLDSFACRGSLNIHPTKPCASLVVKIAQRPSEKMPSRSVAKHFLG